VTGERTAEETTRIGLGYDVHAFAPPEAGRPLVIGGVQIDYGRGLDGHSDADVLVHALTDALLGALRAGDIGEHFPDTDPAFKGMDSLVMLAWVGGLARARGWRIVDIDSVVVAQAPRLAPYRDMMRERLAEALMLDVAQIGVKATTSEHLGFEGRGEGISAQAVALLRRSGGRSGELAGEQSGERSGELAGGQSDEQPAPYSREGCAC
jgi:2-C-methyl-D-erythritol 2,4-cyclodiphosphate synthase